MHSIDPFALACDPEGHSVHAAAPDFEKDPASHDVHAKDAAFAAYVPALHAAHLLDPVMLVKKPISHDLHSTAPLPVA